MYFYSTEACSKGQGYLKVKTKFVQCQDNIMVKLQKIYLIKFIPVHTFINQDIKYFTASNSSI